MKPTISKPQGTTVFFDGDCPLCSAEIKFYRTRDLEKRVNFIDVRSNSKLLPRGLSHDRALARFHLVTKDNAVLSGAPAFSEMWRQVPGFYWLGVISSLWGLSWGFEILYRLFLFLRPVIVGAYLSYERAKTILK